ncbi:MAG: hypothetical protein ACYS5W_12335 [Planctomycetota bacterium]|jgi:hypothetical protein
MQPETAIIHKTLTAQEDIQHENRDHDPEVLFQEISELSLRLMAGAVSRRTMKDLQRMVERSRDTYPWDAVLDRALADPVDQHELVNRGLRAQRDWVGRGGRTNSAKSGKSVKLQAKTFMAALVAKILFGVVYTLVLVFLLVLLEQIWPHLDISRILGFLQEKLPALFPPPR